MVPTVASILTPLGQGGIAVLRVVGPRAFAVTGELFRPKASAPPQPDPRRLLYGHIVDDGEVVDEVLVRFVPADPTQAAQSAVEVNCHGGLVAVQRILECFTRRGIEPVEQGALVGLQAGSRIEAEARQALLSAATPLGAETLLDQLDGALDRALAELPWQRPEEVARALRGLLATERLGRALWQPPTVTLAGPTNAGKSTLFNALAREDRMIVSPTPGTTRDAVSAEVAIAGLPVWLTDTAGEREPGSTIEAEAIAGARRAAAAADIVLLVVDGSSELPVSLRRIEEALAPPHLLVLNKADLGFAPWARSEPGAIAVSAIRGDGLDELTTRTVAALVGQADYQAGRAVVFTERQSALLRDALEASEAGQPDKARGLVRQCIADSE